MKNWKLYIWRVLEGIGIIAAIVGLVLQYQSLQEQKILGAWQLITTKVSGNSGKIQALEFLNSKGVPLVGVDLSNAYLSGVNLKGANLQGANFTNADLTKANFTDTVLYGANFNGAVLFGAHFNGAELYDTIFEGAIFENVNDPDFTDADFIGAYLTDADFNDPDFTKADLTGADFTGASFWDANFEGAFVYFANLLPTAPKGYEFLRSKKPPKDGKIYIELIKKQSIR